MEVTLVFELLVLTVIILTPSLLTTRSLDDIGRLATGCSPTDDAGLLVDSDDARRSDDMGFSVAVNEAGGFVSTGDASVLTDSCTGKDGGLDVGRGGVLVRSGF